MQARLLLVANHKRRWWKGISIDRGETVISLASLSKITDLSTATVSHILTGLQKSGEITRKRCKKWRVITRILKYSDYQHSYESRNLKIKHLPSHKQEMNNSIIERNII